MAAIPDDIVQDMEKACCLHDRAVADYSKCLEFSAMMTGILARLEDAQCWDAADKVMAVLLDCNPKAGSHCDKATVVGQAVKKLSAKQIEAVSAVNQPVCPDF